MIPRLRFIRGERGLKQYVERSQRNSHSVETFLAIIWTKMSFIYASYDTWKFLEYIIGTGRTSHVM